MLAANAAVELKVDHIPREHCRELENILSDWAKGLRQQAGRAYADHSKLLCGSLRLNVAGLVNDGVLTWQDTLHPAQPVSADSDENEAAEPQYERGTGELLAPAVQDSAQLLPGGAAAARRRQLAQAAVGDWSDVAASEGPAGTPQPKRRRVGLNKCHNCGSYKHSVNKCPEPYDHKRVAEARNEQSQQNPAGRMLQMKLRYFEMPGGSQGQQAHAEVPLPGVISQELADALGMASTTAPPPWLPRMVVLGVPPRYAEQNEEEEEDEEAGAEPLMVFYGGSDDEHDAAGLDGAAAAAAEAAPANQSAAAGDGSDGSSGSSDDDDRAFIPFDAANGGALAAGLEPPLQQQQQHDQQEGSVSAAQGTLDGAEPPSQQQQEQQQEHERPNPPDQENGVASAADQQGRSNGAAATAAAAAAAAATAQPKQLRRVFPGVNADAPADVAWTQAVQGGVWLKGRLEL